VRQTFVVTGATGFIGGALARRLVNDGHRVVAICRDGDPPRGCEIVRGDIEDLRTVERAVVEEQPDGIFHLAAQPIVGHATRDPYATMETNIRGTYGVLEAFRRHRKWNTRLVVASSDKAYGELPAGSPAYTEDMPLRGRGPYDVSKTCTDLLAQSYGMSYSLPIAIIRAGNVYGPGDDDLTRIIPSLCDNVIRKEPLTINSDGSPVREYLYVDDVVDGYVAAFEKYGEPWARAFNLGTDEAVSVKNLALEFVDMLRKIERRVFFDTDRELHYHVCDYLKMFNGNLIRILGTRTGEIQTQILDDRRARKEIGWAPSRGRLHGMHDTLNAAWLKNAV
jgi:CDP-glucose 4,6-dehydratase